jgi:hypothetical protein
VALLINECIGIFHEIALAVSRVSDIVKPENPIIQQGLVEPV